MKADKLTMPSKLLAKSVPADGVLREGCFLITHTLDVVRAAESILNAIESNLQRFFKLSEDQMSCLHATARLAAYCHDLGKANDSFQAMITKQRRNQAIRHEHLSALLMSLPEMRGWLEEFPKADYELARLIVLGHHLKVDKEDNVATKGKNIPVFATSWNGEEDFVVCSDSPDFKDLLRNLCKVERTIPEPQFTIPKHWSFFDSGAEFCIEPLREQVINELNDLIVSLRKDDARLCLLWAAKSVFFAADASASGLRRTEAKRSEEEQVKLFSIDEWIRSSLLRGKSVSDIEKLIEKRKTEVVRREKAKGHESFEFKENDFQREMSKLEERALLLAPCGSGKTLAAYLWIQKQLETRAGWKVVFLYPTTGTATEGFKDYASHDEEAALVHSRAAFDLEGMFKNPDDERSKNDYSVDQRLYALGYWPDALFSATADAFLSFLQNSYSSLCLLPVLARSIIVIDEIHSFDYAMFDALIEFLQKFDAPVLLMTASLQKQRREKLERASPDMRVYPKSSDMERLEELRDSADFDRYCIKYLKDEWKEVDAYKVADISLCPNRLIDIARQAQDKNLKVLWVANTVDRCVKIAKELNRENVFCYHSRFMYCDRVDRHRKVVDAFHPSEKRGVIAITTQVCEMSLDLDADVLIMELAPAPSLIQRMGRCNRSIKGRPPQEHGQVYIYEPCDTNPYGDELIQSGRELLASLKLDKAVKQSELAAALEEISQSKERGKRCLFTMAMWESYSGNDFRETDEFTVSAVLESKLTKFQELQRARDSKSAGLILQAPRRLCMKDKPQDVWLAVVPDVKNKSIKYSKTYGLHEV
jgi:CRISPR-associated endonuclease/helicase Cas3